MELKLKKHRSYLDGENKVVKIVRTDGSGAFTYEGEIDDGDVVISRYYNEEGKYSSGGMRSVRDLVSELPLKLEVGAVYADGLDEKWRIEAISDDPTRMEWKYRGRNQSNSSLGHFNESGCAYALSAQRNLVCKIEDEPKELPCDVSDYGGAPLNTALIRAVLDGKTVQWRLGEHEGWRDLPSQRGALVAIAHGRHSVRLKPEIDSRWFIVHKGDSVDLIGPYGALDRAQSRRDAGDRVVRLDIDPDSLEVTAHMER